MKKDKLIFWTPRIASILFILFLSLFSLDVFGQEGYGLWETVSAFLMHNIPVFVLIAVLWISWKREIVGAVAFFLAGLLYIGLLLSNLFTGQSFEWYMLSWSVIIAGPAFAIGWLFLLGWKKRREEGKELDKAS